MGRQLAATSIRGPRLWLSAGRFLRDPIPVLRSLHQRYGRLVAFPADLFRRSDSRLYLMAFGPEHNERILTDTDVFKSRGMVLQGPNGSAHQAVRFGLISMNGEQHQRHRSLLMPAFHRQAVQGYRDIMAGLTADLVDQWRVGETRDIARDMRNLALDVSGMVLFGYSGKQGYRTLGHLIERWMEACFSLKVWFLSLGSARLSVPGLAPARRGSRPGGAPPDR